MKTVNLIKQSVVAALVIAAISFTGCNKIPDLHNVATQAADEEMYEYKEAEKAGRKEDYATAMQWYLKAADKGNVTAMENIGYMYEISRGVSKDYAKAMQWYLKAADKGSTFAMEQIGEMYLYGSGVPKDGAKMLEWWQKAAESGNVWMMGRVASTYLYGSDGVTKDPAKAIEWYKKVVEHDKEYPEITMAHIGTIYYDDLKDYTKAREWYTKAKEAGDRDAGRLLRELDKRIQQGYLVTADPTLNVRSGPGAEHQLLGTLAKGNVVSVKSFSGDWAEIAYEEQTGYVSKQYLKENLVPTPDSGRKRDRDADYRIAEILLYVVLGITVLTWIVLYRGETLTTAAAFFCMFTMIALSAIELVFFLVLKVRVWFCDPESVGWGWTIVNFFLFLFVMLTQFVTIRNFIGGMLFRATFYFPKATGGKIILIILVTLVSVPLYGALFMADLAGSGESFTLGILVTAMALFLAAQIIMIFIYEKEAPGWTALLCVLATVGLVVLFAGFILTLIKFLFVLIMAVIAVIGLMIAGKVSAPSSSTATEVHYSDGTSEKVRKTGTGAVGETYYEGEDSGREFVK